MITPRPSEGTRAGVPENHFRGLQDKMGWVEVHLLDVSSALAGRKGVDLLFSSLRK